MSIIKQLNEINSNNRYNFTKTTKLIISKIRDKQIPINQRIINIDDILFTKEELLYKKEVYNVLLEWLDYDIFEGLFDETFYSEYVRPLMVYLGSQTKGNSAIINLYNRKDEIGLKETIRYFKMKDFDAILGADIDLNYLFTIFKKSEFWGEFVIDFYVEIEKLQKKGLTLFDDTGGLYEELPEEYQKILMDFEYKSPTVEDMLMKFGDLYELNEQEFFKRNMHRADLDLSEYAHTLKGIMTPELIFKYSEELYISYNTLIKNYIKLSKENQLKYVEVLIRKQLSSGNPFKGIRDKDVLKAIINSLKNSHMMRDTDTDLLTLPANVLIDFMSSLSGAELVNFIGRRNNAFVDVIEQLKDGKELFKKIIVDKLINHEFTVYEYKGIDKKYMNEFVEYPEMREFLTASVINLDEPKSKYDLLMSGADWYKIVNDDSRFFDIFDVVIKKIGKAYKLDNFVRKINTNTLNKIIIKNKRLGALIILHKIQEYTLYGKAGIFDKPIEYNFCEYLDSERLIEIQHFLKRYPMTSSVPIYLILAFFLPFEYFDEKIVKIITGFPDIGMMIQEDDDILRVTNVSASEFLNEINEKIPAFEKFNLVEIPNISSKALYNALDDEGGISLPDLHFTLKGNRTDIVISELENYMSNKKIKYLDSEQLKSILNIVDTEIESKNGKMFNDNILSELWVQYQGILSKKNFNQFKKKNPNKNQNIYDVIDNYFKEAQKGKLHYEDFINIDNKVSFTSSKREDIYKLLFKKSNHKKSVFNWKNPYQNVAPGFPEIVFRINFKDYEEIMGWVNEYLEVEDAAVLNRYIKSNKVHPLNGRELTLGWVRHKYNKDTKEIFVEEIQTDLTTLLKLEDTLNLKFSNKVNNDIAEYLLRSFLMWRDKSLGKDVRVIVPNHRLRNKLAGMAKKKDEFGFEKDEYEGASRNTNDINAKRNKMKKGKFSDFEWFLDTIIKIDGVVFYEAKISQKTGKCILV